MRSDAAAVGIVGAGAMGLGMARSLARAGFAARVRDIDPAREREARDAGLAVDPTVAALAAACDAVAVVVVDAAQIGRVLDGDAADAGLLAALRPGAVVLVCSTIGPRDAERFAERLAAAGARPLDAPISGGPARAADGTMTMMLAGAADALAAAEPITAALAARRFRVSERPGDATRAKLVNNLMAGVNLAAGAEAFALGVRLGLEPRALLELVSASSGQSWIVDDRLPRALAGDLAPRARVEVLAKDLSLAIEAAADAGVPVRLGPEARALFDAACADGRREQDDAALLPWLLERSRGPGRA